MSEKISVLIKTFRPQRYPALVSIVGDFEDPARSLADRVCDAILRQIISGELSSNSKLRGTQVASDLGVSRTPVAKALAKLTADGILVQPDNHQAIVVPGAENWLLELHTLRRLLEPEAAARSTGDIDADVLEDLAQVAEDAKPRRGRPWREAARYFDFALHLTIAEFCGNVPMKVVLRKCWSYKRFSYELTNDCQKSLKTEYEEHVDILNAMASDNPKLAFDLTDNHIKRASIFRDAPKVV